MTYPDHHEGIRGTDRNDWLLSLQPQAMAHRDAIAALATRLYDATVVGNPAPKVQRMHERITNPQLGDLVVEVSRWSSLLTRDTRYKALGILVAKRKEWFETNEERAQYMATEPIETPDERATDTAWYIQYGPNAADVTRWADCMFIAVPIEPEE